MIVENQSSVDRKNRKDGDLATNLRETRSFACYALDQTNFQLYRSEFNATICKIRAMRLMEHLGRYTPKTLKEKQVAEFHSCFKKTTQCLASMLAESEVYKVLMFNQNLSSPDPSSVNSVVSVKQQREEDNQFRERIIKNVKEVQTLWLEVFEEGSLKRLVQVLQILRMEDFNMTMHYDISEWALSVETNLVVSQRKKRKGIGCCL